MSPISPRVLVVGSGGAGVAAALEASRNGADVILLESREVVGGATSWSGGIIYAAETRQQMEAGIQDTKDELLAYYMAVNQYMVAPRLLKVIVDGAHEILTWLEDLGIRFKPEDMFVAGLEVKPRGHKPSGDTGGRGPAGGAVVINAIVNAFDTNKVQVHTSTRITSLRRDADGTIRATSDDGRTFQGESLIFASGGFGANNEKLAQYYPQAVKHEGWTWYIGPDSNQGDAIEMGLSVGGILVNPNRGILNVTPNFIHVPDSYMPPWLIFLNTDGLRFVDEMSSYCVLGNTLVAQPDSRCWGIFDSRSLAYIQDNPPNPDPYGFGVKMQSNWEADTLQKEIASGRIIKADSLDELARLTGMPAESVAHSISKWNQDAAKGQDPEYGKVSSEIFPVNQAPYYAADVRPHLVGITYTGLKIDEQARLLDQSGRPIPNFYAAGEVAGGLEHAIYPGGGYSVGSALVFGRIAGRNAALEERSNVAARL